MDRIVFVEESDIEQNICDKDSSYYMSNNNDSSKINFENIYEEIIKNTKKEDEHIKINRKTLRKKDEMWFI
jgi:hypothetical protein